MHAIISPAKKIDFDTPALTDLHTEILFAEKSKKLVKELKKMDTSDIKKLMKLSDNLAELNYTRFQNFKFPHTLKNSKQAAYTFKGDTYVGLRFDELSPKEIKVAQKKLKILSGLYGVLRPLDLIHPYRLEMGTSFGIGEHKNLYQVWKKDITNFLNQEMGKKDYLVNLASNEYFSAVDQGELDAQIITPKFLENKNGTYKVVSFSAKRARGMMANFIIKNQCKKPQDLFSFNDANYSYNESLSSEFEPAFTR